MPIPFASRSAAAQPITARAGTAPIITSPHARRVQLRTHNASAATLYAARRHHHHPRPTRR